jgi:hypothetical protein
LKAQIAGALLAAGASFHDAAAVAKDPNVQFRLLLEEARVFEKEGKASRGTELLKTGLPRFTAPRQQELING